jgi:hypothetical protein
MAGSSRVPASPNLRGKSAMPQICTSPRRPQHTAAAMRYRRSGLGAFTAPGRIRTMAQRQPCHRRHSSLLRMINPEDWRRSREGNTRGQERRRITICCSRMTSTRRRWSRKPWAARSCAFAPALLLRRLAGPQSLVHRNDSGQGKMKLRVQGVTWATPRATALLALGPAPPLGEGEYHFVYMI